MEFITDKQTLLDLNITGRYRTNSLFFIFNKVKTKGGEKLLESLFLYPLADAAAINNRSRSFNWFQEWAQELPVSLDDFRMMEDYLHSDGHSGWLQSVLQFTRRKFLKSLGLMQEYNQVKNGLILTARLLTTLRDFFMEMNRSDPGNPFSGEIIQFEQGYQLLKSKLSLIAAGKFNAFQLFRLDHLLRNKLYNQMQDLLALVYKTDMFITVSNVGRENGWQYATALPEEQQLLEISNCRHPAIKGAIGNDVVMSRNSNTIFLTGANMAGKSTFMKSLGIAVYLAHMGFPLAVDAMRFSVKNGLFTSINVPDDLNQGFSHFYAEVLRVKKVAELVQQKRNLLVIFDELFKGTNVKDAYDATLSVTKAFAGFSNCQYIISTHIIEVGEALREASKSIQFRYMPTIMEGNRPRYTYKLAQGITSDRHGMKIIQNEKIVDNL